MYIDLEWYLSIEISKNGTTNHWHYSNTAKAILKPVIDAIENTNLLFKSCHLTSSRLPDIVSRGVVRSYINSYD